MGVERKRFGPCQNTNSDGGKCGHGRLRHRMKAHRGNPLPYCKVPVCGCVEYLPPKK